MMSPPVPHDFLAIDYHVRGIRTAMSVARGDSSLVGLSIVDPDGRCSYYRERFADVIQRLGSRHRVYHDAIFSRAVEATHRLPLAATFDCTKTMLHLLDENQSYDFFHVLKASRQVLPVLGPGFVWGGPVCWRPPENSALLPWLLYRQYDVPGQLTLQQLEFVYRQIELPLIDPVVAMTQAGLLVDQLRLAEIHDSHETQAKIIQHQVTGLHGELNLDADDDVRRLLFDTLGLPVTMYTDTGLPSTSEEALGPLVELYPVAGQILRYRHLRAVSQAATSIGPRIPSWTGYVHPNLDPLGATTGRFSCSEPNLQGLPAELIAAIVAERRKLLLEADFSQFELRVLAHMSQDPALCAAFAAGRDIHVATASRIFQVPEELVTPDQRRQAKAVNFGIIYGESPPTLGRKLQISLDQASALIAGFDRSYPGVRRFIDSIKNYAATNGFVSTLFGRRRRLPDARSYEAGPLRQAVNAVIQGTAADLIKLAISRLYRALPPTAQLLLTVHDSVLLEVEQNDVQRVSELVRQAMEWQPAGFTVPLTVDIGVGASWAECKQTPVVARS